MGSIIGVDFMVGLGRIIARVERESRTSEADAIRQVASALSDGVGLRGDRLRPEELHYAPVFAARWAKCGFPLVRASHKLAASLAATRIHPDSGLSIGLPWPCFCIVPPDGMFGGTTMAVIMQSNMLAKNGNRMIRMLHVSRNGLSLWEEGDLTGLVGDINWRNGDRFDDRDDCVPDDFGREMLLFGRFVLGVCIELDQPKHRVVIGNGPPPPKSKHGRAPEPKAWTFNLTRDVKVDCREWVTSYLSGKPGTKVSVQSLVRGHHKRQPCGPNGSDRKWIHVEPYWRGPEDAPIAVRSHSLSD